MFCVEHFFHIFFSQLLPLLKPTTRGWLGGDLLHYESNLKTVNIDTRKQTFPFQMNLFIFEGTAG